MKVFKILTYVTILSVILACVRSEDTAQSDEAVVEPPVDRGAAQDYNADVSKILGILINNLYTNRSIFLREVISNASDALDKVRFLYLTEPKSPKSQTGEEPTMDVRIRIDRAKRTLTIRDGGVGMTREELTNNLGMLGASGTKAFLERINDASKEVGLIGQFGVGFYSVFLAADRVSVSSKSDNSEVQWTWESSGDGKFFLYEDPRGNTLGRGTELTLHLKEDAEEFLGVTYIKDTIRRYSEFIHFPLFIEVIETKRVPKPAPESEEEEAIDGDGETKSEDEVPEDNEEDGKDDKETASEDDSEQDGEKKKKKKKEQEFEEVEEQRWERINENEPIWTRKVNEVTEEEHNKFFRAMTRDYSDPMYYSHFKAEGDVDFNSILYIPSRPGSDSLSANAAEKSIRLYVRRVFITDEFRDLLPRYLSFVQGVVDSDDLPLNVSRELLQENRVLKIIKKKLLRKVLSMIADIAQSDLKLEEEEKKKKEKEEAESQEEGKETPKEDETEAEGQENKTPKGSKALKEMTYGNFWEKFGTHIRLGVIEDHGNKSKLTKLLRYKTSKHEDKWSSLDAYIERMPSTQSSIFFVTGESLEKIKELPVVEDALKRDVEVLFMTEPIDEYVVSHMTDYNGKRLVNLAKEGAKLGSTTARDRKIEAKRKEKYSVLTNWFKKLLGDNVTKVILTQRLTSEPVLVTSSQYGVTAMMSQILKHQALTEKASNPQKANKILEINHLHPLIQELNKRIAVDEDDEHARSAAHLLFSTASLQSGFDVDNVKEYSKYVDTMVRSGLEVSADAGLVEEDLSEYDVGEDTEETNEDDSDEGVDVSPGDSIPIDMGAATETIDENGNKVMSFDLSGKTGKAKPKASDADDEVMEDL